MCHPSFEDSSVNIRKQAGFTLVEIAIVLVIIGLLLGGILKGQELINSARVRNLADTNSGIQAAYYGFVDRYRQVPGDMTPTQAEQAIGTTITVGGNGNGQVDAGDWEEASALWVHLTLAGFLQGSYTGGKTDAASYATAGDEGGPRNAFNGLMLLGRGRDYATDDGTTYAAPAVGNPVRLLLIIGDNIPVDVAREMDVKIDDQRPGTGSLRMTGTTGITWGAIAQASGTTCVDTTNRIYNITDDDQNCNLVYIY